jgi:hypothetical protein
LNNDNIEINGFNIDGQEQYNNGVYIQDSADHVDCSLKWCSIYDFQGIAIDPYDDDTNTDFTVSNCKVYNNGNGIKLSYGGNTIQESLIYNNTVYSIHSNYTRQTFNHIVCWGNQYGIYLESLTSAVTIKNSIFAMNSLKGISSEVSIIAESFTYNCIPDGVDNVDISHASNTTDDPLFVNTDEGDENFNIKVKEGAPGGDSTYIHDSPCKDASDDDPVQDIGAYDVDRSIAVEYWRKYQLEFNPFNMNDVRKIKGNVNFNTASGALKRFSRANKRVFPMQWADDDLQSEEQINMIAHLSMLVESEENQLTEDQVKVKMHLLPSQKLHEGTAATVDATAKTITEAGQSWEPNKYKGYEVGLIFTSGSGMVIDSVAKTGTKAGAGWTVNEWAGYKLYYNFDYYTILSNTATVLTLSDELETLVSATIDYSIEKYFKISRNTSNVLYLIDADSELVTGSYDYYIDSIIVRSTANQFQAKQDGFIYQDFHSKTGYSYPVEEV